MPEGDTVWLTGSTVLEVVPRGKQKFSRELSRFGQPGTRDSMPIAGRGKTWAWTRRPC